MKYTEEQATLFACPSSLSICLSKPFPLKAPHSMAWSMIHTTVHFITLKRPTCPAHYATRMRRQLPSCIQHDSLAHRDGMRSTPDTWQLNYRMPELRNKTQSVWIKTPYQYQGAVQTLILRLSTQCTSAAMDCLVLRTLREGPSRVPSAPSNIEPLTSTPHLNS